MKKQLLFGLIFMVLSVSYAQKDTLIYTYSEEVSDSADEKYEKFWDKWFPQMTEVEELWKLSFHFVPDALIPSTVSFFVSSAYENRIKKNFYYEIGISAPTVLWNTEEFGYLYAGTAWSDIRYYYSIQRSRKRGKRAHSLFGNYIALGLTLYASNFYLDYENTPYKSDIHDKIYYDSRNEIEGYSNILLGSRHLKGYMIMPTIKYGLQRKMWDFGYLEVFWAYGIGKSFYRNVLYQNFTAQFNVGFDLIYLHDKWLKK